MSDEGLHEFQLNGKQLVFLFMTATVIAVVIFLCGVMVGRGVPTTGSRPIVAEGTSDPTSNIEGAPAVAASGTTAGASASSAEQLTYAGRLEDPTPVNEVLHEAAPATVSTAQTAPPAAPAPAKAATPGHNPPPRADSTDPPGNGFVVQVAAVRQRAEADTIRRRLAGKGYPAFVSTPAASGPAVFRVRVGKYDSRREAESIAGRLEREEQFKPWITR